MGVTVKLPPKGASRETLERYREMYVRQAAASMESFWSGLVIACALIGTSIVIALVKGTMHG